MAVVVGGGVGWGGRHLDGLESLEVKHAVSVLPAGRVTIKHGIHIRHAGIH